MTNFISLKHTAQLLINDDLIIQHSVAFIENLIIGNMKSKKLSVTIIWFHSYSKKREFFKVSLLHVKKRLVVFRKIAFTSAQTGSNF